MKWLDYLNEVSESGDFTETEFELTADSHIVGTFEFGPYEIGHLDLGLSSQGKRKKLFLRIFDNEDWEMAAKDEDDEYYFEGGIPQELTSLTSLFLRRRLKLGKTIREAGEPSYRPTGRWRREVNEEITSGKINLDKAEKWFEEAKALPPEHHEEFMLATRYYHRSLIASEEEPDIAYIRLVTAIEVLSSKIDLAEDVKSVERALNSKCSNMIDDIEDQNLADDIREAIIDHAYFTKRHFIEFIKKYTRDGFWGSDNRPDRGKVEKDEFEDLLGKIYDQRSKTLHDAEPFPPSIVPTTNEEISRSLSMSIGNKTWQPNEFLPTYPFFERLVNHVLKNFLEENNSG